MVASSGFADARTSDVWDCKELLFKVLEEVVYPSNLVLEVLLLVELMTE